MRRASKDVNKCANNRANNQVIQASQSGALVRQVRTGQKIVLSVTTIQNTPPQRGKFKHVLLFRQMQINRLNFGLVLAKCTTNSGNTHYNGFHSITDSIPDSIPDKKCRFHMSLSV